MNVLQNVFMNGSDIDQNTPLQLTVEARNKVAKISIIGYISKYGDTNSAQFRKDIKAAKSKGATDAELYINSEGGSVFDANEILNLIEDNFENVKVTVGAIAASAATIFIAKYPTTAKANSQIMIHKPMMGVGGNEDEIEARLKLLKDLTGTYRTMYAEKMGIDEDKLEALWKNDFWMNAKEAHNKKFIDAIYTDKEKIDATTRMRLVACGAPDIPKIKNQKTNTIMELSVLAVTLGLPADATQDQVDAKLKAVQALAAKAEKLEKDAKDKEKADKVGKVKALLDAAEKDKKIDATMRANYEAIGENNLEQLEAILKNAKPIEAASKNLSKKKKDDDADTKDRSGWTFGDYQEKDPEAFIALTEEDPEAAEKLANAHYKEN